MAASPKKKIIFSLKPHRCLRAVQIYSQHYYKNCVQPAKLTLINKLTQDTFKSESKEVKTEVFDALEQLREELAEASQRGEQSPEEYLDAIDAAPALLNRFLHDLALQTGWWFTVIAGGFHVGVNGHKKHFENEYTHHSVDPKDSSTRRMTFKEGVITPYGQFLKMLFSQRACNQADLQALKETLDDDEHEGTPGLSSLIPMPHSPSSPPVPSFQPSSMPVPAILPCSAKSPPNASLISTTTSAQGPVSMSSTMHPSSSTSDNADITSLSLVPTPLVLVPSKSSKELGGEELDPQIFWQDAGFGHEYFSMSTTERDRLNYDNLLGHSAFDYEGESFPLTLGAIFGDNNGAAGNDDIDLRIPSELYDQFLQPGKSQLPLLPSPGSDEIDGYETNIDLLLGTLRPPLLTTSHACPTNDDPCGSDVDGNITPILRGSGKPKK
ncbi:hypothetical protein ARMSODRAFT_1028111 [Armillaria solidipes]|uniref:Uncharacterized protein n=1 Tax=Armillaria solidipes TaxID=1076256 RepID=A0A2H3APB8_9AGAR|nr:hypothetical protein ARMSODRAFT_1028111 [Armillaria solidipes]